MSQVLLKSFTTFFFFCVQKLWRMGYACLRLSQGLLCQARWSGWGRPLPFFPFNRRSNTVANVMCNKTHFYCPPSQGLWIGAECGKREIPHSQRDGWWVAALRRRRSQWWTGFYGRNSELSGCWWEGNPSSHTLVDKELQQQCAAHKPLWEGLILHRHVRYDNNRQSPYFYMMNI